MTDARFEDAAYSERPLRLRAESEEDLAVVSSLVQDAVGKAGEVHWMPTKHRLVLMLNRFRWENHIGEATRPAPCERVRTALSVDGALRVRARGLDPHDGEQVFELLAILFDQADEVGGRLVLTMAGDAEIAVEVECLELALTDLSQPWTAKAQQVPAHDD